MSSDTINSSMIHDHEYGELTRNFVLNFSLELPNINELLTVVLFLLDDKSRQCYFK